MPVGCGSSQGQQGGQGGSPGSGGSGAGATGGAAHNGRIAFDGANYAGYFGIAISVSQACVGSSTLATGVNIHQGDRMKVVSGSGALLATPGFGLGCSHSGYERVIWDPSAKKFVPVCKNDAPTGGKSGRIALAPNTSTIYAVDLNYSDLGNVMVAGGGGYWIISSDIRAGQTANSNGLADVHLLHMPSLTTLPPDHDLMLVSDTQNDRAPHLAATEPASCCRPGKSRRRRATSRRATRTGRCTSRSWTARPARRPPARRRRRPDR